MDRRSTTVLYMRVYIYTPCIGTAPALYFQKRRQNKTPAIARMGLSITLVIVSFCLAMDVKCSHDYVSLCARMCSCSSNVDTDTNPYGG